MNFTPVVLKVLALCLLMAPWFAEAREYPPRLPDARVEVYKTVDDIDLKLWIYQPKDHRSTDSGPAIVFFFGGGWNGGSPEQFEPHAKHLAKRGMIAMVADYRVKSRQGTAANIAVEDARSAVRWIRINADKLGVDPNRIAAGGGSAGGHLAAATSLLKGHDDPADDLTTSASPDALILFNPVLVTAPVAAVTDSKEYKIDRLRARLGASPESMSPYHHVRPGLPPTIIFHGKDDETVPYASVELFAEAMQAAGNRCELVGYAGEGHGFFNSGRGDGSAYTDTVQNMDTFLDSLGWTQNHN